ncbi:MAG: hypothetical protein RLZZ292_2723, partial [Bacteroidota bacterium]
DTWSIEVVDSVYNGYCLDHKRKNDFFYECVADFQKGNISILNNALKNYFKIKYNKLTEQDKYKIISWVCELERIDGGMEHTVYSEVSEDWKVFEYECLNLRNQHFMDSLCQQELSSSPGYNHCPYDSEFKIYQFEGRCKQMFIDRKIRDYSRFYIVFDENLVGTTLCHKFLFEYHFFEDKDGFLQITKKILNPEVGGYNRCG